MHTLPGAGITRRTSGTVKALVMLLGNRLSHALGARPWVWPAATAIARDRDSVGLFFYDSVTQNEARSRRPRTYPVHVYERRECNRRTPRTFHGTPCGMGADM